MAEACGNLQTWLSDSTLTTVEADTEVTGQAARSLSLSAVEASGPKLQADAETAGLDPPPIDTQMYINAMAAYAVAGQQASVGRIPEATEAIRLGSQDINKVTAAVKADCGG